MTLVVFALAEVSGAPVLWRGPVIAWLLAALVGIVLARSKRLRGQWIVRWSVMVTVCIALVSVGTRIGGNIAWETLRGPLTPAVQDFIRVFDPQAEFLAAEPVRDSQVPSPRRGASVRIARAQHPVAENPGVDAGRATYLTITQWTPAMNSTALRFRDMTERDAIIAVSNPSLQPYLPIVSERRAWVAGLPHSSGYTTAVGRDEVVLRTQLLDAFLRNPNAATVLSLRESGITWLWITPESFGALEGLTPWTETVDRNDDVALLRLTDAGASSA
jgi:hypothetical protein